MDKTQSVTVLSLVGILIIGFIGWEIASRPVDMMPITSAPDSFNLKLVSAVDVQRLKPLNQLTESKVLDDRAQARAAGLCVLDIPSQSHATFYSKSGGLSILNDLSTDTSEDIVVNVEDPDLINSAFTQSQDHVKDALNPAFEYIGIGYAECPQNDFGNKSVVVEFFTGHSGSSI